MLIKIIIFSFFSAGFLCFFSVSADAIDISAQSAIVINADTKEILYEKNAFERRSMASTTKIMTGILAAESGRLNETVTATDEIQAEGTSIGLKTGDKLSLKSLLYGLMLESGNDAANLCAVFLSGNISDFSILMNRKAKEIGMKNTNFVTPSGLDDEMHYSTAYDMALLGAYCIRNPVFNEVASASKRTVKYISPEKEITFYNHNRLLSSCNGVFGIKTGFTKKSGRCLVTACKRDSVTLICVTLKAYDDWNDHKKLFDCCFSEIDKTLYYELEKDSLAIYGADKTTFRIGREEFIYSYKNNKKITEKVLLPRIIYAPIKKNDVVGTVLYYSDGILIGSSDIYSREDVNSAEPTYEKKISIYQRVKNYFIKRKD